MARIVTQQLWLNLVNLIQNSMNTSYSFQDLASDLEGILSEIPQKCPGIDSSILARLKTAKEWAEADQREQSLGSLYTAYEELAKKYLSAKVSLPTGKYLMELIEISSMIDNLGVEYHSILEYGVDVANGSKQKELKEYCQTMLENKEDLDSIFQSRNVNYDNTKEYLNYIKQLTT